jgi:ribosomal protein S18 acetylase RimI-like enzyme
MEYLIRECKREDLPELVELCARHAMYEKSEYHKQGKEPLLQKAIFSEQPCLFCIVIEINGKLVGFASYTFDFSTWDAQSFLYLDCLYLDDEFRGLGIGDAIIQKLLTIGTERKCINIQWQTPHWNDRAIKFYNRIGGRSKDKVRFTLKLSDTKASHS